MRGSKFELTLHSPIKSTWQGGALLASNPSTLKEHLVTRQEYQEIGTAGLQRRFAGEKGK